MVDTNQLQLELEAMQKEIDALSNNKPTPTPFTLLLFAICWLGALLLLFQTDLIAKLVASVLFIMLIFLGVTVIKLAKPTIQVSISLALLAFGTVFWYLFANTYSILLFWIFSSVLLVAILLACISVVTAYLQAKKTLLTNMVLAILTALIGNLLLWLYSIGAGLLLTLMGILALTKTIQAQSKIVQTEKNWLQKKNK